MNQESGGRRILKKQRHEMEDKTSAVLRMQRKRAKILKQNQRRWQL